MQDYADSAILREELRGPFGRPIHIAFLIQFALKSSRDWPRGRGRPLEDFPTPPPVRVLTLAERARQNPAGFSGPAG